MNYPVLGYHLRGATVSGMPRDERYTDFERALATARTRRGLTQQQVANLLRRPQSFVSKYESGERRLDVIEFLDVCAALGISTDEILVEVAEKR